jgi:hypothetical protein
LIRAVRPIGRRGSCSGGLCPRAWWGPVFVVVLGVRGQDPPKVLFAVDRQVVEALAP